MTEYELARLEVLKGWIERRNKCVHQIGHCMHLLQLIETLAQGSRSHVAYGVDDLLRSVGDVKTLLATNQHELQEDPPP